MKQIFASRAGDGSPKSKLNKIVPQIPLLDESDNLSVLT
jgi:hypothetical protein